MEKKIERLVKRFRPEKYQLWLALDKEGKRFEGEMVLSGRVRDKIVKLHAVGLDVREVLVNGEPHKFETPEDLLVIPQLDRGPAEIRVLYSGRLNENMEGAYLSTYQHKGQTETIVATQIESHYARQVFPCVDEPEAKAVFLLSILLPAGERDTVLSNMPVKKVDKGVEISDGWRVDGAEKGVKKFDIYEFEETPKMSTYLLAFVVGKLQGKGVVNKNGVKITTYAPLNQGLDVVDFANEVASRSLEFYDDNFGVKYPLVKLDQVALPDFEAGAMENWGLVTYRESMLLAGKGATLSTRKSVALTVAHELSHQWFGDLVTMKWWDDLWLNESFASVMEYYAVDALYPEYKIWEGFFTGDAVAALKRDCLTGVQSVHQVVNDPAEIATLFDPAIVYAKGARLILMVIRLMGWKKFCEGVQEYFEGFAYGIARGDDLWKCLSHHTNVGVRKMMHAFIDQPGYPVVKLGRRQKSGEFLVEEQKRFLLDDEMYESAWPLMTVREDMSGHYVVNLSDEEFAERLLRFNKLGLEEKLRLLIDRDLVARTKLAKSASLLKLLKKFKDEESAAVWGVILSIVSALKVFFDVGSEDERRYKWFVKELVRSGLARVGLVTREDDDENTVRLRAILVGLDFYGSTFVEGVGATKNLKKLAQGYNQDLTKIDAEMRGDILAAKIYLEPGCFDEFLEMYGRTADPEIKYDLLFAMTMVRDEVACDKVMRLLEMPEVVKPQDQFYLFIYLYRNPVMRERAFLWLTLHWDYVKEMAGDKSLENYPRYTANSVRTQKEFEQWRGFFGDLADDPALARAVTMGEREIEARLKLIAEDGATVRWLLKRDLDARKRVRRPN